MRNQESIEELSKVSQDSLWGKETEGRDSSKKKKTEQGKQLTPQFVVPTMFCGKNAVRVKSTRSGNRTQLLHVEPHYFPAVLLGKLASVSSPVKCSEC